jgi:hypothetical protein
MSIEQTHPHLARAVKELGWAKVAFDTFNRTSSISYGPYEELSLPKVAAVLTVKLAMLNKEHASIRDGLNALKKLTQE